MKTIRRNRPRWQGRTEHGIIKGHVLNPSAGIESRYFAELRHLIEQMTAETERELLRLFDAEHAREYFEQAPEVTIATAFTQDASISSQARIVTNALIKKFTEAFAAFAKPMAERFTKESDKASDLAVKSSLRSLSDELTLATKTITSGPLADILNATVTENVGLIKSIPQKYLSEVQGAVMRSITTGRGKQDLVPFLQKHKGITIRRARMISQDQTRKAFATLSRERMKKAGLKEYIWRHTSGSREPRELHIKLDGQVCRYDDPPVIQKSPLVKGHPGHLINCACRMQPILKFGEE